MNGKRAQKKAYRVTIGGHLEPSTSWRRPSRRVLGSSWKRLVLAGTRAASYAAARLTRASVGVLMLMRFGTFQDVQNNHKGTHRRPKPFRGTSRTTEVLEKTFEKSLGIIPETSCTIKNTYSELRRFAAHSREASKKIKID